MQIKIPLCILLLFVLLGCSDEAVKSDGPKSLHGTWYFAVEESLANAKFRSERALNHLWQLHGVMLKVDLDKAELRLLSEGDAEDKATPKKLHVQSLSEAYTSENEYVIGRMTELRATLSLRPDGALDYVISRLNDQDTTSQAAKVFMPEKPKEYPLESLNGQWILDEARTRAEFGPEFKIVPGFMLDIDVEQGVFCLIVDGERGEVPVSFSPAQGRLFTVAPSDGPPQRSREVTLYLYSDGALGVVQPFQFGGIFLPKK